MAHAKLTAAVQHFLLATPIPVRALARGAGVSHTLLRYIASGKRAATPELAERLADTLERLAGTASSQALKIRAALQVGQRTASSPRKKPRHGSGSA
jgi:plasmid maintenance system antidote protein VapI